MGIRTFFEYYFDIPFEFYPSSSWNRDVPAMFWQFVRKFGAVEHYFGHVQNYVEAFELRSRKKRSVRKGS